MKETNHQISQARKPNLKVNTEATREVLHTAVRRARETADRVQEEYWLEWCWELDGHTSSAVLWQKLRIVSNGAVARPAVHPHPQAVRDRLVEFFAFRAASARLPPHVRALQEEANPGKLTAKGDGGRLLAWDLLLPCDSRATCPRPWTSKTARP